MKSRILSKWPLYILGIAVILFFSLATFFLIFELPAHGSYVQPLKGQINLKFPARLKIPSVNINAAIEQVGLTQAGAMDVPQGPAEAAWLNLGPRPGEPGSSVIDGHSGWKNGIPAVFDNLYKLKKGDKIYVEDGKGETVTFAVREIKSYDPKASVPGVFNSNDEKAHLNLITCSGIWDSVARSHSKRLVVFTDLLSS